MPGQAATTAPAARGRAPSSPSSEATAASGEADRGEAALARCAEACASAAASGTPVVLACPHSAEGILAGVGVSYLAHVPQALLRLSCEEPPQPRLGEALVVLPAGDAAAALAERVYRGLVRHLSVGCPRARRGACPPACDAACARRVPLACAADGPEAAPAVLAYARLVFARGAAVRDMVAHPVVTRVAALARITLGECHHAEQFVRFSRMSDGSYLASFSCKANYVPFVAEHFAARMGTERFCLVDPSHGVAAFHEAGRAHAQVVALDDSLARQLAGRRDLAADEPYVRALWQTLYRGLSLPGRGVAERGYDLRASWMPKRFWSGLTELAPASAREGAQAMGVPARYRG